LQLSADQARNIKIKTGSVRRTTKEYLYYFKEQAKETATLNSMRDKRKDEYDIKQQENVVQESSVMIPATKKSLEGLLDDLKACFQEVGDALAAGSEQREEVELVIHEADVALTGENRTI
jgi:tubulin-specific chaperone A